MKEVQHIQTKKVGKEEQKIDEGLVMHAIILSVRDILFECF